MEFGGRNSLSRIVNLQFENFVHVTPQWNALLSIRLRFDERVDHRSRSLPTGSSIKYGKAARARVARVHKGDPLCLWLPRNTKACSSSEEARSMASCLEFSGTNETEGKVERGRRTFPVALGGKCLKNVSFEIRLQAECCC